LILDSAESPFDFSNLAAAFALALQSSGVSVSALTGESISNPKQTMNVVMNTFLSTINSFQ
jgi:hypothetical protein